MIKSMPAFAILLSILFLACKSDHLQTYKIEDSTFVSIIKQEILWQQILNQSLIHTNELQLVQLGQKRNRDSRDYLSELQNFAPQANLSLQNLNLSQQQQAQLALLNELRGSSYKAQLYRLLVTTDQDMIGLHVKAVGAEGLKNADLRYWADKQIVLWQSHLAETQLLRP